MDKKYVNPKQSKEPITKIASAGMRREVKDPKTNMLVPNDESVIEAKKWVEYTQL